ncbi:MAG: M15 family metallopeptidase [Patescibacteria group bacterium]|nr:M15 family metallopeptidase [Patescibacteria group bacterium]
MEKNLNKIVAIFLVIIIIILFFLYFLLSKLGKRLSPINQKRISPTKIVGFYKQEGNTKKIEEKNNEIITSTFAGEDGFGEDFIAVYNIRNNELKKKLPLKTDFFEIFYNEETGKFFVNLNLNVSNSYNQFLKWLAINGFNSDDFIINQTTITLQPTISIVNQNQLNSFSMVDNILLPFLRVLSNLSQDNFSSATTSYNLFENYNFISPMPISSTSDISSNNNFTPSNYNPNRRGCYTPERFIEVYADGLTPNGPPNCYANVKTRVESYLVRIPFLGLANIPVHKKTASFFKAVDEELAPYKVSGSTYRFQQGNYTFKFSGTYVFRCNVNASGNIDRFDLCNSSCVLSPHSFGFAIDLNADTNRNKSSTYDMPPEAVAAFRKYGFRWGGEWNDAMHFEYLGEICPP